jgi:clan AA aspartic protease (TIGR02281 family)
MKKLLTIITMFICFVFLLKENIYAELYTYTDKNGDVHIVDDIDKLPKKLKEKRIQKTKVTIKENRIIVPVTINYKGNTVTTQMTLDTGATGISITPAVAKKLGMSQEGSKSGTSKIADGSTVQIYFVTVNKVTVGTKSKENIDVHVTPYKTNEETGLLGISFLGDFPHTINMKQQTITWL